MEITNYDPAITLWSFSLVTAKVFAVQVVAETENHIYQDAAICIAKSSLPTFANFHDAKQELVAELARLVEKATALEAGNVLH